MWLALQLSHNDVLGVGLGWVLGLGGPESLPLSRPLPKKSTFAVRIAWFLFFSLTTGTITVYDVLYVTEGS